MKGIAGLAGELRLLSLSPRQGKSSAALPLMTPWMNEMADRRHTATAFMCVPITATSVAAAP